MDNQQLFLRGSFKNKHYSIIALIYTSLMVVLQVSLGYLFGIMGVAVGRYLAILISIALGYLIIRKNFDSKILPIMPSFEEKKKIVKLGLILMLSNSTSILIQLNEVFMLGVLLKDQNLLADYKVASYILVISTFFVQSIAMFIYPYFSKHSTDKIWIWKNYKRVIFYNSIIILPLHLMMYIFAKPFLSIIFGYQYTSALPILRIFLIASLSQTLFRMISGNILAAIGEEKYNLKVNIISIFIHLVVDYWAITTFGIYGAAMALAVVYFISGLLLVLHLKKVVKRSLITSQVT
jgi:O-antigen/teichoic acid export membrane protein